MTIKVNCKSADTLPIDRILEFQGDLKKLTKKNRDKLQKSIERHGFIAPIFVWENQGDYMIIDGHQRLATLLYMRQKGWDIPMLPVDYIEADSEQDARDKLLHITSSYGEFNVEELEEWVKSIDDLDDSLRFTGGELEISFGGPEEETVGDDEVQDDVEPVTKLGDLWELGSHRLLCGDSTDKETVGKLMDGQKADMAFTDPPYSVEYQSNKRVKSEKFKVIKNDDTILNIYPVIDEFSKGWVFVWTSWKVQNLWIEKLSDLGYPSNMVIWYKPGSGIGDLKKTFSSDYEVALVWHRGAELTGKRIGSVWKINKDGASTYVHPTQKPVELSVEAFDKTTNSGDIVLDLFGGSGSTLLGAEKTGRISRLMELSEHYCDVIVNRYKTWCDKNGKEPIIKLNGEVYKWQSTQEADQLFIPKRELKR